MNLPHEIIKELESDNSRLFKESVIKRESEASNDIFFHGCKLALSATTTFGLKQIEEKTDEDGPGLAWDDFFNTVSTFIDRSCTGNLARDTIKELMAKSTKEQWNNWYRRILIKDLRCGTSVKTINKVVKKHATYTIPVFSCQLAHDSANHESKVSGKKLLEVKLDGVRVLTVVYPNGRVDQYSRNGKELLNFEQVKQQFSFVANTLTEPTVFDGEIMSSSFQDLMTQVNRKENVSTNDAILYLFDMIPLADFEKGSYNVSQHQRSNNLKSWFNDKIFLQLLNVRVVKQELVDLDTTDGYNRYLEINQTAIDGGYEGMLIKDPNAPYVCDRSVAWLKLKPFIEVTLRIVSVEEGTGKYEGTTGALVCDGIDDEKEIMVNVGSGFSDKLRSDIWESRHTIINELVEVRADAITKNRDGTYSLRFPRFKCFRGFTPGEKL
jgi:DNA ligase-1